MVRATSITLVALAFLLLAGSPLFAETRCRCWASNSYWCSGAGNTCAEAQSNFSNYCDDQAENACVEGLCSLIMSPPNSCTQYPSDPGHFWANGTVTYRCIICIDFPDFP